MMEFDDRSGKTQPVMNALQQNFVQSLRDRKKVSGGLYPQTATKDQIINEVIEKPRKI